MSKWLFAVKEALDESPHPVTFFFRDDDGGWDDSRLFALMRLCSDYRMTLDVAVIPNEITPGLKARLQKFLVQSPQLFGIHQHGFAHVNHESDGRKCEFGLSRNFNQQKNDIHMGQQILEREFGDLSDPIFTPPWNRCTIKTADCLVDLGFKYISRDETALPFGLDGLEEIPINIDWFAKKKGIPLGKEAVGNNIAEKIKGGNRVGIMFHHALMDENEMLGVEALFKLLSAHKNAKVKKMTGLREERFEAISKGV